MEHEEYVLNFWTRDQINLMKFIPPPSMTLLEKLKLKHLELSYNSKVTNSNVFEVLIKLLWDLFLFNTFRPANILV